MYFFMQIQQVNFLELARSILCVCIIVHNLQQNFPRLFDVSSVVYVLEHLFLEIHPLRFPQTEPLHDVVKKHKFLYCVFLLHPYLQW